MTRGNVSRRQNQPDKRVRDVAKTYTQDAVREISGRKVDDRGYRAKTVGIHVFQGALFYLCCD